MPARRPFFGKISYMKRSLWEVQSHGETRGVQLVYNSVGFSCSLLTLAFELRCTGTEACYGKSSFTTAQLYAYFRLIFFFAAVDLYSLILYDYNL